MLTRREKKNVRLGTKDHGTYISCIYPWTTAVVHDLSYVTILFDV